MPTQPPVSASFRLDLSSEPSTHIDQKERQRELADKIREFATIDDIRMLLVCGASAQDEITLGLTPLHYACHSDYWEAAKLLLVRGAKVDSINAGGYSPMHMCAERGNYRLIRLLLDYSARVCFVNKSTDEFPIRDSADEPLRLAIRRGNYACAKLLLENGADANARYFDGPEICHVPHTETQFLTLLLSFGADPNVYDRDGLTPLMKACRLKEKGFKAIQILLTSGADINAQSANPKQDRKTALHVAVLSGSLELVRFLLDNNADVNMPTDYDKASPLDLAVLTDNPQMVSILLEAGADVNAMHSLVGSPLHFACSPTPLNHRVELIDLLLKHGANPNLSKKYEDGAILKSPLVEYFRQRDDADFRVVKLFFCYGAHMVIRSPASDPRGQLRNLLRLFGSNPRLFELIVDLGEEFDRNAIERLPILQSIKDRLIERTKNPGTLKQLARLQLRSSIAPFSPTAVDSLPLPRILKSYLLGLIVPH